jgi:hypothetical protein
VNNAGIYPGEKGMKKQSEGLNMNSPNEAKRLGAD